MSVIYSCRWLAYTLVCVNVALAVRAGVCHILEVINQAGNQTAAKVTPGDEEQKNKMSCCEDVAMLQTPVVCVS